MIKQFNILRFILALLIFLHHLGYFPGWGGLAVSIFLVLSGFCYTMGYGDRVLNPDFSYKDYVTRRVAKFYPIHWFLLIVAIWVYCITGPKLYVSPRQLLLNVTLFQAWVPKDTFFFSFNAVSWYLSTSLFLALIFPFLYRVLSKQNKNDRLLLTVFCILIYLLFFICVPTELRHSILYINPLFRIFDFMIGIGAAKVYRQIRENATIKSHPYVIDFAIIISFAILICISLVMPHNQWIEEMYALYWLPSIVLILAIALQGDTLMARCARNNAIITLTQSSFSFYMVHQLVIQYFRHNSILIDNEVYFTISALGISYVLSQILYYVFEKYISAKIIQWITKI